MSHDPLKVVLFLGSIRPGRMGWRAAEFMKGRLENKGLAVDVFDPLELQLPVLETPIHFYQDRTQVPGWLKDLNDRVSQADAFVLVSAEYNHSMPPALTNMMNHFSPYAFTFKPSLIVTYSVSRLGGSVAISQLRTFTSILGCPSVPFVISIPEVMKSLDENGAPLEDRLEDKAARALDQLLWVATAFKDKTIKDGPFI